MSAGAERRSFEAHSVITARVERGAQCVEGCGRGGVNEKQAICIFDDIFLAFFGFCCACPAALCGNRQFSMHVLGYLPSLRFA